MVRSSIFLLSVICALCAPAGNLRQSDLRGPRQEVAGMNPTNQSAIKVTITTVGPMLGPPTDRYKVGEQIPVTIELTNTLNQPAYACVSGDLYQDLPTLTKKGDVLPYTKWQSTLLRNDKEDRTCETYDLPERMMLKSNEPFISDFV